MSIIFKPSLIQLAKEKGWITFAPAEQVGRNESYSSIRRKQLKEKGLTANGTPYKRKPNGPKKTREEITAMRRECTRLWRERKLSQVPM